MAIQSLSRIFFFLKGLWCLSIFYIFKVFCKIHTPSLALSPSLTITIPPSMEKHERTKLHLISEPLSPLFHRQQTLERARFQIKLTYILHLTNQFDNYNGISTCIASISCSLGGVASSGEWSVTGSLSRLMPGSLLSTWTTSLSPLCLLLFDEWCFAS